MFFHGRPFCFLGTDNPDDIFQTNGNEVWRHLASRCERLCIADLVAGRLELRPVVVVSAMSGMTDALVVGVRSAAEGNSDAAMSSLKSPLARHVAVARKLLGSAAQLKLAIQIESAALEVARLLELVKQDSRLRSALRDEILAYGERLSSALLAAVLCARGVTANVIDSRRCIVTDEEHGCASPLMKETSERTRTELAGLVESSRVPVLGGFIGATLEGKTTTLGRGGSDYTAALVGAALAAREIQIWTDVCGVLTADPRVVPNATTIPRLSYAEAAELAYFGAKVLHPKTIQPAIEARIPLRICNSRAPEEPGTVVGAERAAAAHTIKAIAHKTGITTLQISSARMLGAYGFLRALFEIFDRHRTVVDVVTTSEVSVSVSLEDITGLPAIIADLERLGSVQVEGARAIVCIVGEGLRGTPGIAARVFSTISDINVMLISQGSSSINLTFVVEEERVGEAVRRLHEALLSAVTSVNEVPEVRSLTPVLDQTTRMASA